MIATDLAGNITIVNFTVDTVYPVVTGVYNNSINKIAVRPVVIEANTASIELNNQSFLSGTLITANGKYTLIVTDLVGRITKVVFTVDISPKPTYAYVESDSSSASVIAGVSDQSVEVDDKKSAETLDVFDDEAIDVDIGASNNKDGSIDNWVLVMVPLSLAILVIGYWIVVKK